MNTTATKERPIIFNAAMVRAILEGSKTQTRRVLDLPHLKRSDTRGYDWTWRGQAPIKTIKQQQRHPGGCWQDVRHARLLSFCPYGQPGDRLWVREAWAMDRVYDGRPPSVGNPLFTRWFAADNTKDGPSNCNDERGKGRPSIHMPRWASRITLEVTDVRVERVQEISEFDIRAEGLTRSDHGPNIHASFRLLWDSINAKRGYSWESNPWVWAITFRKLEDGR